MLIDMSILAVFPVCKRTGSGKVEEACDQSGLTTTWKLNVKVYVESKERQQSRGVILAKTAETCQ